MDNLPTELLVLILKFLDGENVVRFKALNCRFGHIITKNRTTLRFPSVNVSIKCCSSTPKTLDIHLHAKLCFFIEYSNPNVLKLTPMNQLVSTQLCTIRSVNGICNPSGKHFLQTYTKFFHSFFDRNISENNLEELFTHMFQKIEIKELDIDHFYDDAFFSPFINALSITATPVHEVHLDVSYFFQGHCKVLREIGKMCKNGIGYPIARFQYPPQFISQEWNAFTQINELAADFASCWYTIVCKIPSQLLSDIFLQIAMKWFSDPFPQFNFGISILENEELQFLQFADIDDRFDIVLNKSERILCSNCDDASVQVVHRNSGDSLTFNRTNENNKSFDSKGKSHVNIFIHALLK